MARFTSRPLHTESDGDEDKEISITQVSHFLILLWCYAEALDNDLPAQGIRRNIN